MLFFRLLLSLYLSKFTLTFSSARIDPETEFHHKSRHLLITCNATLEVERPILIYKYNGSNYTVLEVPNPNPFVYVGNFTNLDPSQSKVNVLCLKSSNGAFLTSRIYFFGYSPAEILTGALSPQLHCRDFNFRRIECCIEPSWDEIEAKLSPSDEQIGNLRISLTNLNYRRIEKPINKSCFKVAEDVYTTWIRLNLFIKNDLGNQSQSFSYNRSSIYRPARPVVILKSNSTTNIQMTVSPIDDGEFEMNFTCSSETPSLIVKHLSGMIINKDTTVNVDGWKPNSRVHCRTQLQIFFGKGEGQFSEEATANVKIPEGRPNNGPFISPAFVSYQSISSGGVLQNVLLYFIDIPLIDQNGKIIEYRVFCENCKFQSGTISDTHRKVRGDMRHIRLDWGAIGSSISITACTRVGCSELSGYFRFMKLTDSTPNHRIFLIRNPSNSEDLSLMWYLKNETSINAPYILLCSTSMSRIPGYENDCSSIMKIDLGGDLVGKKSIKMNDVNVRKFAFIPGLNGTDYSQLDWNDCIYEASVFDVENLRKLPIDQFISSQMECNLKTCSVTLVIRMPSCKEFRLAIFSGIFISYESEGRRKNLTDHFRAETELRFTLTDLRPSTPYHIRISMITSNDDIILWYKHDLTTAWWNITKVVLIFFGFLVCVAISIVIFKFVSHRIRDAIFKNDFEKPNAQFISRTNSIRVKPPKPLTLNNAEYRSTFQKVDQFSNSPSSSPIPNYDKTYSTNVELTDTSSSSYDSGNSGSQLVVDTGCRSDSYVKRPDAQEKVVPEIEVYAHLCMPSDKGDVMTNTNLSRLSQETHEV